MRASKALLQYVQAEAQRLREQSSKKNLLDNDDSGADSESMVTKDVPIWLSLTTKQHIVDKNRLKPSKVIVPHSIHTTGSQNICLIVADPQRGVKNILADPTFPQPLATQVSKVIGFTKLKARYKTFESRRQLLAEHDVFLADDRVITRLPETLGKVFYKATSKRPIPIDIAYRAKADGKFVKPDRKKPDKHGREASFAAPMIVAKEIERTLGTIPVSLRPGTLVAVKVATAKFTPQQLTDNVVAVTNAVIDKHVVKGWRNVKAIHVKSPRSAALPVWLADDMWAEDGDVREISVERAEQIQSEAKEALRKRKRNPETSKGPQAGMRKKAKADAGNDFADATARKTKLEQQKRKVFDQASGYAVS